MARVILLALLALVLLAALLPPIEGAYQIYYRVSGDPRPGSEIALQLAMSKPGGQVRPIGGAEFNVMVEGGDKPISVKAGDDGVTEVRLKIPLSLIFGGVVRVHVSARSDFYAASAERLIEIGVGPDYIGLACLAAATLSVLVPILAMAARRWRP